MAAKAMTGAGIVADITLHIGNKKYSSWSLRAWLALKQTGAPFEEAMVPLDQPETRTNLAAISPSARVPVLRHGEVLVWESLAICEHLAEAFPAARLWPQDAALRAHARAISHEMHGGFVDLRRHLPMDLGRTWPPDERLRRAEADIARVAAIWRDCRTRFGREGAHGGGDFLFGGFTIADAMYAPVTTRFLTYGVPLDAVSADYVAAMARWPAMREWAEAAKREPWEIRYDVNSEEPSHR